MASLPVLSDTQSGIHSIGSSSSALEVARADEESQSYFERSQFRWRAIVYVLVGLAVFFMTRYFSCIIAYDDLIRDVGRAVENTELKSVVGNGSRVALSHRFRSLNAIYFHNSRFADAVVAAYYTTAVSSDFIGNMTPYLRKMYNYSKHDTAASISDIIAQGMGKRIPEQQFCSQPMRTSPLEMGFVVASHAIASVPFYFPFGTIFAGVTSAALYGIQSVQEKRKCTLEFPYCSRAGQNACGRIVAS